MKTFEKQKFKTYAPVHINTGNVVDFEKWEYGAVLASNTVSEPISFNKNHAVKSKIENATGGTVRFG